MHQETEELNNQKNIFKTMADFKAKLCTIRGRIYIKNINLYYSKDAK